MVKNWITLEIPPGYVGETPKVYQENGCILSVFVKLTPSTNGTDEETNFKTENNGSKNRKQGFNYKFEPKLDGSGYWFNHQNGKRWGNSGKTGSGIGLLIKGFFNVFGSKK